MRVCLARTYKAIQGHMVKFHPAGSPLDPCLHVHICICIHIYTTAATPYTYTYIYVHTICHEGMNEGTNELIWIGGWILNEWMNRINKFDPDMLESNEHGFKLICCCFKLFRCLAFVYLNYQPIKTWLNWWTWFKWTWDWNNTLWHGSDDITRFNACLFSTDIQGHTRSHG